MTIADLKKIVSSYEIDETKMETIKTFIDLAYALGEKNATTEALKTFKRIIRGMSRSK